MKRACHLLIAVLLMAGSALSTLRAAEPIGEETLAAMPLLERGITQLSVSVGRIESHLSIRRSVSTYAFVIGKASTRGVLNASLRLLAPIHLAPAFLAIDLSPHHITGLMTLFLGPVSIDLGRRWLEQARWLSFQLTVHPRLSLLVGIRQTTGRSAPRVGWRFFPTGSARWDVELTAARDEMRLTFGGFF